MTDRYAFLTYPDGKVRGFNLENNPRMRGGLFQGHRAISAVVFNPTGEDLRAIDYKIHPQHRDNVRVYQ